tara:strand:+ start:54 stop:1019 length:966 start_codon:yes stop_codon:yes gene_type:complete
MGFPKFQTKEVLNKVLNTGEDALKVDIDNVSLDGSQLSVDIDKENDSIVIFSNTVADGSGTNTVPLVDAAGNLQIDIVSSTLPSGGATAANQSTIIGHVDGVETLLGTIDSDTDAIKTSLGNIDNSVDGNYLNVNMNLAGSDAQAGEGTISATTQRVTIATDDDGVAHLATIAGAVSTQMQVDVVAALPAGSNTIGVVDLGSTDNAVLDAIDAVLDTIKTDTGTIDSDTNDTKNALNKMLYGTGLVIAAVHGGSGGTGDQTLGATYESLYVGVGGDVVVTLATSASDFTFKNVASGQMLPIQITHVKATNTTATNMIAMKA